MQINSRCSTRSVVTSISRFTFKLCEDGRYFFRVCHVLIHNSPRPIASQTTTKHVLAEKRVQATFCRDSVLPCVLLIAPKASMRSVRDWVLAGCRSRARARNTNRFTIFGFSGRCPFECCPQKTCDPQRSAASRNRSESHTMKTLEVNPGLLCV